jgi:hypothetical protein
MAKFRINTTPANRSAYLHVEQDYMPLVRQWVNNLRSLNGRPYPENYGADSF